MPLQDTTKTCTKCGETKPATNEYFARDSQSPSGLTARCKACAHAYYVANKARAAEQGRARYAANKEQINERNRAYQAAHKDKAAAYRAANRERRREQKRARYAANKEREKERRRVNKEQRAKTFRAWYYANQERQKQRVRDYYAANRAKRAQYARDYRAANHERVIENLRQYHAANKERSAEYYLANKERHKVSIHRRRARMVNAEGTHTAKDIAAQYERQKGKCYYCATKVGDSYHLDHIVPISRGGTNWPENLVIACEHCNLSKNDKLPHEWIEGGRLL